MAYLVLAAEGRGTSHAKRLNNGVVPRVAGLTRAFVIHAVGIVVAPSGDLGLGACLASVDAARRELPPGVDAQVVVVLDGAVRVSEVGRALGTGHEVVIVGPGDAPAARRLGARWIQKHYASVDPEQLWLATTDGKSSVPRTWLVDQLELADAGIDSVALAAPAGSHDGGGLPACAAQRSTAGASRTGLRGDVYEEADEFADVSSAGRGSLWRTLLRSASSLFSNGTTQDR